jgi:hypothetical protein
MQSSRKDADGHGQFLQTQQVVDIQQQQSLLLRDGYAVNTFSHDVDVDVNPTRYQSTDTSLLISRAPAVRHPARSTQAILPAAFAVHKESQSMLAAQAATNHKYVPSKS